MEKMKKKKIAMKKNTVKKKRKRWRRWRNVRIALFWLLTYDDQRKFSSKFSELWTNVQGQSCHHVHVSSCQPHHHVNHLGRVTVRKRVNSRVKTLSGAKPCVFFGTVAPGVAEVKSLFPQFQASIWESCRPKVHRTLARAWFSLQNVLQLWRELDCA